MSEKKRRQWVDIFNSSFDRCMKGKTRIKSPDTKKCEGFAFANANGVVFHMKFQAHAISDIRLEKHLGRLWLVAPTVMIKERVLNGNLVPGDEIGRYVETWNGIPVTMGHPEKNEQYVSANTPEFEATITIGRIWNARFVDNTTLKAEAWIDIDRVKLIGGNAQTAIEMMQADQGMEVSSAYFSDIEFERGHKFGEDYDGIVRNIRPDHLAILLDEEGACSWRDGCGIPRVNEQEDTKEKAMEGTNEILHVLRKLGKKILGKEVPVTKEEAVCKLTANEKCKFTAEALATWELADLETLIATLEVEEPVAPDPAKLKEKSDLIEKLTANKACKFAKAELEGWEIGALKTLVATLEEKPPEEEPKKEDEPSELEQAIAKAMAPFGTRLDTIDEQLKAVVSHQKRDEDEVKAEYIDALKANESCKFDEKELTAMSVETLDKLARSLIPADFTGRPFPTINVGDEIPDPPKMEFSKAQLGWKDNGK